MHTTIDLESQTSGSELPWLPFLLQTSDALFPTGAYAHSLGFEEVVRLKLVHNEATLTDFLTCHLLPALAEQELPYLRFAHAASNLEELCTLDFEISAWKLPRELREASIQLGNRRLKALLTIHRAAIISDYTQAIADKKALGHHLVISALQARVENIPLQAALTVYAYQTLAACCCSALKLIRIGQDGCQRVLRETSAQIPGIVTSSLKIQRENAGYFNPLLEVASMRHESAIERLFIS